MKRVIPVIAEGSLVHAKIDGTYSSMGYNQYLVLRASKKTATLFAEASFPYICDVSFESLLPLTFVVNNRWRKDMLAHWYWTHKKTGISSIYERLDALEFAATFYSTQLKRSTQSTNAYG